MNTPTHSVCGACVAQVVACATAGNRNTTARAVAIAAAVLLLGVVSHLLLDLLPHYAWIVYLDWFKTVRYRWLIREAVFGLAVAAPALLMAGKAWPIVVLGMGGGMCPDVGKGLAVDLHLPGKFILFDWHSTYLSGRTGGLPQPFLIVMECCLIAACRFAMWKMERGASNNTPVFVNLRTGCRKRQGERLTGVYISERIEAELRRPNDQTAEQRRAWWARKLATMTPGVGLDER